MTRADGSTSPRTITNKRPEPLKAHGITIVPVNVTTESLDGTQ